MFRGKLLSKMVCTILVFALISSFVPVVGANAVTNPFSDVSETDYFYTEVTTMYGQGVISGYGNGTFLPQNSVTHAEAIKLVCSMAGVAYSGYSGKTEPWYTDVVTWAMDNGIMSSSTNPTTNATREEICSYIALVYKINTSTTTTNAFSDTTSKVANTLYDYGVIKGLPNADGTVSFGGTQNVLRCDTCIMLYRLSQKVAKPSWAAAFALDTSHYAVSKPTTFTTFDDYVAAWNYMLVNVDFEEVFAASITCSKAELDNIMDDILNAYYFSALNYFEYASFLDGWEVNVSYFIDKNGICSNPKFTLSLSNDYNLTESELAREVSAFTGTCEQIVTTLYTNGSLRNGMSMKEKAHVLYVYMAYNTKYDTSYTYYTGYDAAVRHTAVCQGYTAMYNYLCNLAGVPMEAMTGAADGVRHSWSRIYYNGSWYNVDTTWSDPIPDKANYCDEIWFWVSDSYLKTCSYPRTFDSDTLVYG